MKGLNVVNPVVLGPPVWRGRITRSMLVLIASGLLRPSPGVAKAMAANMLNWKGK
jgi:hypothetical protein